MKTRPFTSTAVALALSLTGLACAGDAGSGDEASAGSTAVEASTESREPVVVASGFNGPQGVMVADDGSIWVIDSGMGGDGEMVMAIPATGEVSTVPYGQSARVVRIAADGSQTVVAPLPSIVLGEDIIGGARLVTLNGIVYATSGAWAEESGSDRLPNMAALVRIDEGGVAEVANAWDLEGSQNPAGALVESHPYDLAVAPDGTLWMSDAAGNTLLTVDPASGTVELKAVFDALPGPIPNAHRGGAMETEPVPTGIAFDAEGNTYVSFLPGVPFLSGSAKVVRVAADGSVSDYATDLTMLTDLTTGPDGRLYAISLGEFTEEGPVPNSGAILRISEGTTSETIVTGLSFPTSIAFAPNGDAYVTTNGMGPAGAGEVVRHPGLARGAM